MTPETSTGARPHTVRPNDNAALARRATFEVMGLTVLVTALALLATFAVADLSSALRPSDLWAVPVIAVGFGATLLTVFRVEFRGNAILFSLSEIPLIFALVYLDPIAGIVCRLVASAVVYALIKKPPVYKLLFNLALFWLETSVAYLIMHSSVLARRGIGRRRRPRVDPRRHRCRDRRIGGCCDRRLTVRR